uniref:EF-hand domain-containing protein n=1 Tax=Neobodo designis TaxID=312471 RepID=A0A7S1QPJ2_NEODS
MSFRLHICADVGGEKRNVEVTFDRKPETVSKIADEGEIIFRNECALKQLDPRNFSVDFIVFYEDATRRWKPLENVNQLTEYMQLYLFQSGAPQETVREIPAPSSQANAFGASSRVVHRPGLTTIDVDKVAAVFKELDINNTETIELGEMIHGFQAAGIDFNEETIARLFEKSDANSDGMITWEEFQVFSELFPNTVETLYWRLRSVDQQPTSAASQLKRHRQKEHQLKRELNEAERERKVLESRVRQEQAIARELDPRRRFLEEEEQDLINKEFALQFHRDMVVQAETQFSETAVRFDHASQRQGSPRRARYL